MPESMSRAKIFRLLVLAELVQRSIPKAQLFERRSGCYNTALEYMRRRGLSASTAAQAFIDLPSAAFGKQ